MEEPRHAATGLRPSTGWQLFLNSTLSCLAQHSKSHTGYISIVVLVIVAAVKTILTKEIFELVRQPIAYSCVSAIVTILLLLPVYIGQGGAFMLKFDMFITLVPISLAIAIDLACSNVAISLLPLALQQAIASTIPAATILLESVVRRRSKPVSDYVIIGTLCFGAVLGHLGSLPPQHTSRNQSFFLGEAAMVTAIFAAAAKYVFAKSVLHAYKLEVGAVSLLMWVECIILSMLLPWSVLTGEMQALLRSSPRELTLVCSAAALGGFRFYVELVVLRFWSATTLSAANLSAHSLIIVLSIPIFDTVVTPYLIVGTTTTLAASVTYGWSRVRWAESEPQPDRSGGTSNSTSSRKLPLV